MLWKKTCRAIRSQRQNWQKVSSPFTDWFFMFNWKAGINPGQKLPFHDSVCSRSRQPKPLFTHQSRTMKTKKKEADFASCSDVHTWEFLCLAAHKAKSCKSFLVNETTCYFKIPCVAKIQVGQNCGLFSQKNKINKHIWKSQGMQIHSSKTVSHIYSHYSF